MASRARAWSAWNEGRARGIHKIGANDAMGNTSTARACESLRAPKKHFHTILNKDMLFLERRKRNEPKRMDARSFFSRLAFLTAWELSVDFPCMKSVFPNNIHSIYFIQSSFAPRMRPFMNGTSFPIFPPRPVPVPGPPFLILIIPFFPKILF